MPVMYYRFPPYIRGGLQIEIEGQSFLIRYLTVLQLAQDMFAFYPKVQKLIRMIRDKKQLIEVYRDHGIFVNYIKQVPTNIRTLILNYFH
jgi:hypothetical protein